MGRYSARRRILDPVCGVNVADASYDLSRLTDRVIYIDNGQNLNTAELPVPNHGDTIEDDDDDDGD